MSLNDDYLLRGARLFAAALASLGALVVPTAGRLTTRQASLYTDLLLLHALGLTGRLARGHALLLLWLLLLLDDDYLRRL